MSRKPRGVPGKQASAVMAARSSAPDALDFFPTPPWGTRALMEHVLPHLGVHDDLGIVHEPCCGEGHMVEVLREHPKALVYGSDVFDYGRGYATIDYLNPMEMRDSLLAPDWTITNPPFVAALDITMTALKWSRVGVAMLMRTQWVEGAERYEALFRDRPPTLIAPFVERLPMTIGRWNPDAASATSYSWFVWVDGMKPRPPFWIPPGCRERLTRIDDRRRFAAWSMPETPLLDRREDWVE